MSIYGPASLFPPTIPPGWESENPVTRIPYFLFHCARASFGPFERPATFLLEAADAISPPEACVAMDYLFFFESLWVDDADIAAYANSTYGLPARLTTFTRQNTTAGGGLNEVVWTWDVGNGANAEIHAVDLPGTFYQGSPIINRFFWSNGIGVSYWDWHEDYQDDLVSVWDGYGNLPPPTLYGKSESPDSFAAPFGFVANGSVHAPIQRFEDFECKRRL